MRDGSADSPDFPEKIELVNDGTSRTPTMPADPMAAVIAVDVGNSKTDVAIVARDGTVLAARRGPTVSHQQIGAAGAAAGLGRLVEAARYYSFFTLQIIRPHISFSF